MDHIMTQTTWWIATNHCLRNNSIAFGLISTKTYAILISPSVSPIDITFINLKNIR
jgi:hypothetical protein